MNHRRKGVVAIIQKSNRFLLVKRSEFVDAAKGYWCPVSGKVEENETQEKAIEREVMEEVGLEVIAKRKVCDIPSHDNKYQLFFWTTEIISGEAWVASDEASEIKWVTLEEMKELSPVFEEDIRILESISDLI